jgi:hypothetical protein
MKSIINSSRGKYVFSLLLGLGLATIFRRSCTSNNCLLFKAPNLDQIKNKIFSYNNKCYSFKEKPVSCNINNQVNLDIHNKE